MSYTPKLFPLVDMAAKSWRSLRVKLCARAPVLLNHLPEEMIWQEADAIGKQAEQQTHEEMGGPFRVCASLPQTGGKVTKLRRRLLCDTRSGPLWP